MRVTPNSTWIHAGSLNSLIHVCPPKSAMIEKGTGWEKLLGSVKYKSYLSRLCWFIGFYNLPHMNRQCVIEKVTVKL